MCRGWDSWDKSPGVRMILVQSKHLQVRVIGGWEVDGSKVVREVSEARSSRSCISEDKDFKSYPQYGKGHWRVLSKLLGHDLTYIN